MKTNLIAVAIFVCSSTELFSAGVKPHPGWVNSLKPQGKPGPPLTLATEGKSDYTILLPAKPGTQEEKAAADLAHWLHEMTGAEFPVVAERGDDKPTGKEIRIGTDADLKADGYAIAVRDETLFLLGGKARGIINAVYALLEDDLGCRWYARGTSTVPHQPTLSFNPVPRTYVPILADRRDPYYSEAQDAEWSLQNRTLGTTLDIPRKGGGYPKAVPRHVHSFNEFIDRSEFKTHPDYFSVIDGKRRPIQLCLTNPEVLMIVTNKVIALLKADPDAQIVDISPNDGGDACACKHCKPINDAEGTEMGTLLQFANAVADAVKKDFPDVHVTTLAYENTKFPPKTIRPRDNVQIVLCTDDSAWEYLLLFAWETEWHHSNDHHTFESALKAWSQIGAKLIIWDYVIDFHNWIIPLPNMPVVAPNMRYYVKHGATGIFLQSQHNSTYGVDRSLMRSWVWAKQLWDLSRDTRELIRDFNYGFYGKAAEPMQQYDDLLWETWELLHQDVPMLKKNSLLSGPGAGDAFLTAGFIEYAAKLFEKAENLASGDEELLWRVKLAKLPILYLKIEQGPGSDRTAYLKLIDEFESTARKNGVVNVRSGLRGPFLADVLERWRKL